MYYMKTMDYRLKPMLQEIEDRNKENEYKKLPSAEELLE